MRLRRICWLCAVLGALGLYLFCNTGATLGLFLVLALPPLLSGLWLALDRRPVLASLTLPEQASPGQRVTARLSLRGHGRVQAQLAGHNLFTGEKTGLELAPLQIRGSAELPLDVQLDHCGVCTLRLEGRRLDALGLFSRALPTLAEASVAVLPQPRAVQVDLIQEGEIPQDALKWSAQRPGYDPSETLRIRDYVPGDSLRQIYWKLSEKTGRLLVRDLGLPVSERVLLLFETGRLEPAPDPAALDGLAALFVSASLSLLSQQIPHTLAWCAEDGGICMAEAADPAQTGAALASMLAVPCGKGPRSAPEALLHGSADRRFAHTALFAPQPEPEAELLLDRGRVSALCYGAPRGADLTNRVHVQYVDETTQTLEL